MKSKAKVFEVQLRYNNIGVTDTYYCVQHKEKIYPFLVKDEAISAMRYLNGRIDLQLASGNFNLYHIFVTCSGSMTPIKVK